MWSKFFISILLLFNVAHLSNAQHCDIILKGKVVDLGSDLPLPYVNIYIQEIADGTITDDNGAFLIENLCQGEYHFVFSHIGCEGEKIHIDLTQDTTITINLEHTPITLGSVEIKGQSNPKAASQVSINRQKIEDNSYKSFAEQIENETGVHLLKNGSGLSKPVVQGLYGNRLIVLNNGVIQSGQQWGNDHAPEIDANSADKITIIKGTNSLEYGGGSFGGVILMEPKRIGNEPHLHGQVNYSYESNGNGNNLNLRLGKTSDFIAWKLNGTYKKYGDRNTPDYFLTNTGTRESNLSLQLEKSFNEKLFIDFYGSTFNTTIGILRGSHIGNLTDLRSALERAEPFFTEDQFSYDINAPKQHVNHHLAKLKSKYFFSDNKILEISAAIQLNNREEFDIRRGDRSDKPSLSLSQITTNIDVKYSIDLPKEWNLRIGNQTIFTNNTNNPETGVFPLIPDYLSIRTGLYNTLSKQINHTLLNVGWRYDFENQNVVTYSRGALGDFLRYSNNFSTFGINLGIQHEFNSTHSVNANIGYLTRSPGINELYSDGLHQGVSGIEEGNIELNIEKTLKTTLEYRWIPSTKFNITALVYQQNINDYIFLNPQNEERLTIRGAFPVFKYEQTDATIKGIDIATQFTLKNSLLGVIKYSYLKGDDKRNELPLIFMPPNRLFGSIIYQINRDFKFGSVSMEESELEINNSYVWRQNHLEENQDFAASPEAYNLVNLKISTNLILPHQKIRIFFKTENLFNTKYRDYLNRQRYFADDLSRSIIVGANFKF